MHGIPKCHKVMLKWNTDIFKFHKVMLKWNDDKSKSYKKTCTDDDIFDTESTP